MKPHKEPWILRSMLFVPGHRDDLFPKAAQSVADCITLDLQDGVPPGAKGEARHKVWHALQSGLLQHKTVMVRLNPYETGLTQKDLDRVACEPLDGFVYPMANTPITVRTLDAMLDLKEKALGLVEGRFALAVLIETPSGVINAHRIAQASDRIVALLFGAEDYLAALGGKYDERQFTLHTPRAQIVMAARAAGVEPIDTPYAAVHDTKGLEEHARRARELGMSGMLVLSPRQIAPAHAVYTPSGEEIQEARETVAEAEAVKEGGHSYAIREGRLISPSREKLARRILARATAIERMERRSRGPEESD